MRYFLVLLLSCGGFMSLYATTAYVSMGALDEQNAYLCQFINKKSKLAQSVKSPKLMIIAGSNAYAGLSAEIIENNLQVPTFNFGLHAGFSPQFIFYKARQILLPGDFVLLPLEYTMYYKDKPSDLFTEVLFGCGKDFLQELPLSEKVYLLLTRPFAKIVENLLFDQTDYQQIEPHFNHWGDATYNQESQVTAAMRQYVANELIGIQFDENSTGVKAISEFIHWCQQNKIIVFATWPNIAFKPIYRDQVYIQQNIQKIADFYKFQQIPLIGTADDAMFDSRYFYDTSYHLHHRGVVMRTLKLLSIAHKQYDIVLHH